MLFCMNTAPLIIETRGLTKRFGQRTGVVDVNLSVPAGCAFGFLGHNGAGKTTVIRLLAGLIRPDAGTIRISGRPLASQREAALARVGACADRAPAVRLSPRSCGLGSPTAATTGSAATRRGCASGSASPAACWPTRS